MATKTAPPDLVKITDKALAEMRKLLAEDPVEGQGVRLSVESGGCSGKSYNLGFGLPTEHDYMIQQDDVIILLDPKSAIFVKGITLDYQGGFNGRGFVFLNPNATDTCSCGESFNV
jgi:iron-sulfur cluster assembly protein